MEKLTMEEIKMLQGCLNWDTDDMEGAITEEEQNIGDSLEKRGLLHTVRWIGPYGEVMGDYFLTSRAGRIALMENERKL